MCTPLPATRKQDTQTYLPVASTHEWSPPTSLPSAPYLLKRSSAKGADDKTFMPEVMPPDCTAWNASFFMEDSPSVMVALPVKTSRMSKTDGSEWVLPTVTECTAPTPALWHTFS